MINLIKITKLNKLLKNKDKVISKLKRELNLKSHDVEVR